jgi:hypothetical protein
MRNEYAKCPDMQVITAVNTKTIRTPFLECFALYSGGASQTLPQIVAMGVCVYSVCDFLCRSSS